MILLQDLFDDLAFGEFSGMAIGNATTGSINENQYPKVVSLINTGLLDLYTRFPLKKKELTIHQQTDKSVYYLRPDHVGEVMSGDPDIYIVDDGDTQLDGDFIKPIEAFDSLGNEIEVNKTAYPDDIFILEPDVIKILPRDPLEVISIVYQAAHPKIVINNTFNPREYQTYLPGYLRNALLLFIAARLFIGKTSNAVEGQSNPSSSFTYKYEKECFRIKELGMIQEQEEEHTRFADRGWA